MILITAVATGMIRLFATDCAYSPDGRLRWHAPSEWFVDPAYEASPDTAPPCDVWTGIKSEKAVGIVQIEEETEALGPIVARLEPDGSGFLAVFRPFRAERYAIDESTGFTGIQEFAKHSTIFAIQGREDLYRHVAADLHPIRNFQGYSDAEYWMIGSPDLEALLDLDDPRTVRTVCRRKKQIIPWLGTIITFSDERGRPQAYFDNRCDDVAYRGVVNRRRRAFQAIVKASGAMQFIAEETRDKYPECSNPANDCFDYIL